MSFHVCSEMLSCTSLVPKPSHHKEFDHLQYNMQKWRWNPGVAYHVSDVNVYLCT